MLTITPRAANAIRELTSVRGRAGLRISPEATGPESGVLPLEVELVNDPHPSDQVIAHQGSQVFVDKRVVGLLTNRILDVDEHGVGPGSSFRLISTSSTKHQTGG